MVPEALFAEQAAVQVMNGMTGAEIARPCSTRTGSDVPVNESPGGPLSDHYDPRKRAVFLSHPVFAERSVSASAVAAHEVGHAIQHQERTRSSTSARPSSPL